MNNSTTSIDLKQWKVFAPIDISNSQNITLIQYKHYAFCKDITYVGNTLIQLMLILVYLLDENSNTPPLQYFATRSSSHKLSTLN